MSAEDLMAKFTGGQKGGAGDVVVYKIGDPSDTRTIQEGDQIPEGYTRDAPIGGRRRKSHSGRKGNSWLDHVKYTMKDKKNKGKSFKQILKIAKKTYKRSQSQSSSQSGGKRRKGQNQKSQKKYQNGGSGGKVAGVGASASPYV